VKTLLAALLLSALSLTACSKQVSQPAASETSQPAAPLEPKHGYELAKTWDEATAKERMDAAEHYYTNGLTRFGRTESELAHLKLDLATYELCVNNAQQETACKTLAEMPRYQTPETRKACTEAGEIGPKHMAQCDKLIDALSKLIEGQQAGIREDWKQ
jgi:hypothetical protein